MPSNESGSGATTSGGIRVQHYYPVGPAVQAKGFGWSLGSWGGEVSGEPATTLSGGINASVTTGIIISGLITISNSRYKLYNNRYRRNILYRYFSNIELNRCYKRCKEQQQQLTVLVQL